MSEVPLYARNLAGSLQGYLAFKKLQPPLDHHRALGMFLQKGPRGAMLIMTEVPL